MHIDLIHSFIIGILHKIIDDLYDEIIFNDLFPFGKSIFVIIIIFYTIYIFYYKNIDSNIYILLFVAECCFILTFFFKYLFKNLTDSLIFMDFNFDDPFFLLMLIKLPKFIYDFYYVIKKINFNHCFIYALTIILIGLIQDIDNSSFLNIYILKKCNYLYKKEHKIIYRLFLSLLYMFCFYIFFYIDFLKYIFIYSFGYFFTSAVSLYIQIKYEDIINDLNFENKFKKVKLFLKR